MGQSSFREWILRFADRLYRRHDLKSGATYLRLTVVNILATLGFIAFIVLVMSKANDQRSRAVIEILPTDWSVLIGEDDQLCWQTPSDCPAQPATTRLWQSPLKRWSPEYYTKLQEDLTRPFWMGLKISPDQLKKADAMGATRLLLGVLFSRYEVWLDGQRVQTGHYLENDLPVALDITRERLNREEPLSIAVAVFRDGQMRTIDSAWFVPKMGLFTSKAADELMRWMVFTGDTRFLIMFAIFLLFAVIFRFAAHADAAKEELRAAATLAFVLALLQVVMADSIFRILGASLYYRFLTSLVLAESAAVLALGFAISRSRQSLVTAASSGVPIAILLGIFLPLSWIDSGQFTQVVLHLITPAAYAVAGLLCLTQFIKIQNQAVHHQASPNRNTTLLVVTFLLLATACAFVLETSQAIEVETHWARYLVVFPLLSLAATLAADVRRNFRLVETTPVSSYHKMPTLPNEVHGILINLDLKGSEALFRAGAQHEIGGTFVSTILSQLWARFASMGGTVLQSAGDDLLILFDQNTISHQPQIWLEALESAHEELQSITQRLADSHLEFSTLKSLEFRAAVICGAVRPLWRTVGVTRLPAWIEAGSKNIFVESARLLDLERAMKLNGQGSTLILSEDDKEIAPLVPAGYEGNSVDGEGKHGQQYRAKLFILGRKKSGLSHLKAAQ